MNWGLRPRPAQPQGGGRSIDETRWYSAFKAELNECWAGGGAVHRGGPEKRVLGGLENRILQHAGFDGAPPQILIDTVRRLRPDFNLQAVLPSVGDFLLTAHRHTVSKGSQHLQMRRQGARCDVEAD